MSPRRAELLRALLPEGAAPLWTPLLTPYRPGDAGAVVDEARLRARAHALAPSTALWMVAGSTGDGWDLDERQHGELLEAVLAEGFRPPPSRLLLALLRPSTGEVLEAVARVHRLLGTSPSRGLSANLEILVRRGVVGLCVCPPVGEHSQEAVAAHYEAVLAEARLPLALYQLPQVTVCRIEPGTFEHLVAAHEEIVLFKDSSGEDAVAEGADARGVVLVRGAESRYASALLPLGGPYDGLLLSTANSFAPRLRRLVDAAFTGRTREAEAISREVEGRVARLFAAVGEPPVGNAFAHVNRAVVHLREEGPGAPPPLLFDGSRLDAATVERVGRVLAD